MQSFRDISINRKLMIVISMTSVIALSLAGGTILLYEYLYYQDSVSNEISAIAEIIEFNTAAALTFGDAQTAVDALQSLRVDDRILAGRLYTKTGRALPPTSEETRKSPIFPPFRVNRVITLKADI